jgi:dTDP-4-dehydrorhamnose 3,5-epimerase
MIEGVSIIPLKQIPDDRGKVMHMLRSDASWFDGFGEIYFSVVNPGAVKAWRLHKKMVLNYAVPIGRIKLVLYDDREGSKTRYQIQEVTTGEEEYFLIKIPAFIWTGFQGLGSTRSIVANCSTLPHDPDEIVRLDLKDEKIPYQWDELG